MSVLNRGSILLHFKLSCAVLVLVRVLIVASGGQISRIQINTSNMLTHLV
jgi:hypothetical protein